MSLIDKYSCDWIVANHMAMGCSREEAEALIPSAATILIGLGNRRVREKFIKYVMSRELPHG